MGRNLGQSKLRRARRTGDPMAAYDRLPAPVRHWLANAALPWSPDSARRIWTRSRARGRSEAEALMILTQAEMRLLAKDS